MSKENINNRIETENTVLLKEQLSRFNNVFDKRYKEQIDHVNDKSLITIIKNPHAPFYDPRTLLIAQRALGFLMRQEIFENASYNDIQGFTSTNKDLWEDVLPASIPPEVMFTTFIKKRKFNNLKGEDHTFERKQYFGEIIKDLGYLCMACVYKKIIEKNNEILSNQGKFGEKRDKVLKERIGECNELIANPSLETYERLRLPKNDGGK